MVHVPCLDSMLRGLELRLIENQKTTHTHKKNLNTQPILMAPDPERTLHSHFTFHIRTLALVLTVDCDYGTVN